MKFISDEKITVELLALRWVKKYNRRFREGEEFALEFAYKGSSVTVGYKDESQRDAFYDRISRAIKPYSITEPT